MANWVHKVKIKHLLTEKDDWQSVQDSMNQIADVLENDPCFICFDTQSFRNIPKGDEFFGPADYANKLINRMYDFADERRIWIE